MLKKVSNASHRDGVRHNLIIAIDGPAGSGKSTTAQSLAKRLKVPYIDTGAMYRAVTLKALEKNVPLDNARALASLAKHCKIGFLEGRSKQRVLLDGKDITLKIRKPELTRKVFYIAQEPLVRRELVAKQRALGKKRGAVMEGRDIGTVVFPKAHFKFYLDADVNLRAKRRLRELQAVGKKVTFSEVLKDVKSRDKKDFSRKEGPLRRAKDARRLDTTSLTIDQTVDKILKLIGLN